eukprot:357838-Chlamydomonas_euryale.AAC.4
MDRCGHGYMDALRFYSSLCKEGPFGAATAATVFGRYDYSNMVMEAKHRLTTRLPARGCPAVTGRILG